MAGLIGDLDVRRAVHARMLRFARDRQDTLVIDELGLDHGACRIDIAVINGHIRGLEIKSEADTLSRLPNQIAAYGTVVDKASLIVAERHLVAASTMLPAWWGIVLVSRAKNGQVALKRLREERVNRNTDALTLARLLWRPEIVQMLRDLGHPERTLRAPRDELYGVLALSLPRRALGQRVRAALKSRESWRDRPRPQ